MCAEYTKVKYGGFLMSKEEVEWHTIPTVVTDFTVMSPPVCAKENNCFQAKKSYHYFPRGKTPCPQGGTQGTAQLISHKIPKKLLQEAGCAKPPTTPRIADQLR
ncbi:hypothetical protein LXL04_004142 [Taraxacum kok-saghyz]